jgi:hypothetical protein
MKFQHKLLLQENGNGNYLEVTAHFRLGYLLFDIDVGSVEGRSGQDYNLEVKDMLAFSDPDISPTLYPTIRAFTRSMAKTARANKLLWRA